MSVTHWKGTIDHQINPRNVNLLRERPNMAKPFNWRESLARVQAGLGVGKWQANWAAQSGVGVDRQYSGRAFNMFQRLHNRARIRVGVAIERNIFDREDRRVWVDSRPSPAPGASSNSRCQQAGVV